MYALLAVLHFFFRTKYLLLHSYFLKFFGTLQSMGLDYYVLTDISFHLNFFSVVHFLQVIVFCFSLVDFTVGSDWAPLNRSGLGSYQTGVPI